MSEPHSTRILSALSQDGEIVLSQYIQVNESENGHGSHEDFKNAIQELVDANILRYKVPFSGMESHNTTTPIQKLPLRKGQTLTVTLVYALGLLH